MTSQEILQILLDFWPISLVLFLFLFSFIRRIQDKISGRPKREAEEIELRRQRREVEQLQKRLSQQEESLLQKEKDLRSKDAEIDDRFKSLIAQNQRINEMVRSRTIKQASSVASRPYLQQTLAFQSLIPIDGDYLADALYSRLVSALTHSMQIHPPFDISATIASDSGNSYCTTLYSCSCPDFQIHKTPCKHMLRLALEVGLLMGTDMQPLKNEVADLLSQRTDLLHEAQQLKLNQDALADKESKFQKLMGESQQAYPWLADLVVDLYQSYDERIVTYLRNKSRPAHQTADKIEQIIKSDLREWRTRAKQAEYQLHFYESLFPWLSEFKEEPPIQAYEYVSSSESAIDDDKRLLRDGYLSHEEYATLSQIERYQLALERYIHRPNKSNWDVGIEYERYIGYLCEAIGYSVKYTGAIERLEDMGRDLIIEKDSQTILIQCKRWAKEKVIREKHIFQLAGSTFSYAAEHPEREVIGVFVTTADFSPVAIQCAEKLDIKLFPFIPFQEYPRIKCNIGRGPDGEEQRIYHLPMDQQYDTVKIDLPGEFYAATVSEAETAGFRRAYRWHGNNAL